MDYKFHTTPVRSISISPCGNYLASGDEDGNVIVWHVQTCRILRRYKIENKVIDCVEWNPNKNFCLLAVCNEENVLVLQPGVYKDSINEKTAQVIKEAKGLYE